MTRLSTADISEFEKRLETASDIAIITHIRPDGDALGSTTALQLFLRTLMGKNATTVITGPIPECLAFITEGSSITDASVDKIAAEKVISGCDLLVSLDFNAFKRTEGLAGAATACTAPKILIDHHLHPDRDSFDLVFSETEISSTCEFLYHIMMATSVVDGDPGRLPLHCREALMAGMTTDTNNFANSTYPTTLTMASSLIASGVDRDTIVDSLFKNDREEKLRMFAFMIVNKLTISPEGVAIIILDAKTSASYGIKEGETEGLVNLPLSIGKVRMSIFAREDSGLMRISIRSKRGISANLFAGQYFHGGGHEQAAGGKLLWPDDIRDKNETAEYIRDAAARFMQRYGIPAE